jgi:hypothetical protein
MSDIEQPPQDRDEFVGDLTKKQDEIKYVDPPEPVEQPVQHESIFEEAHAFAEEHLHHNSEPSDAPDIDKSDDETPAEPLRVEPQPIVGEPTIDTPDTPAEPADDAPNEPDSDEPDSDEPVLDADNEFKPEPEHPSSIEPAAAAIPPVNEQPDPTKIADKLDDPSQQRDPLLQIAKNKFIAHQDYEATTTVCPVCQAEFNPGAPVL